MGVMSGTESRTDLLFKSADGTKVVLLDVTASGTSKSASSTRKKLIFFGILESSSQSGGFSLGDGRVSESVSE
jgi:hypothetical protein